jgi:predicted nucleic acid-binding protein
MAMMVVSGFVAKAFLDTNILLRSTVTQNPQYSQIRKFVQNYTDAGTELWISRQVIREYISQVTRPQVFMNPLPSEQIEIQYQRITALYKVADETEAVTQQLITLLKAYPTGGKQIHDANIVATMLAYGIDTLLTLNVDDLKRFEGKITIVSPT